MNFDIAMIADLPNNIKCKKINEMKIERVMQKSENQEELYKNTDTYYVKAWLKGALR